MAQETGRRLPWQVIAEVKNKTKGGAQEQSERLSREGQQRESNRTERMWWSQH